MRVSIGELRKEGLGEGEPFPETPLYVTSPDSASHGSILKHRRRTK